MTTVGVAGGAPDPSASSVRDVAAALRSAFDALARSARGGRLLPGALSPPRLAVADRDAWVNGVTEALAEVPALLLAISPSAIAVGSLPVLEGADRALAEGLYAAGARTITIFAGIPPGEVVAFAAILLTDWRAGGVVDLAEALWRAELAYVHLELVSAPPSPLPVPAPANLTALDILTRPPEEPSHRGSLTSAALATLRQLRDTLPPEPASLLDVHPAGRALPAELMAEAARIRAGIDLDPTELGGALLAALPASATRPGSNLVARQLLCAAVDLFGGPVDANPLIHHALEAVDPELTADEAVRNAALAAFAELTAEPLRGALLARIPATETPEIAGSLFSLLSLPLPGDGVIALAAGLPRWALQVLADAVLLREMEDGSPRAERVRMRLASDQPAVLALGLAMAARVDDPRLLEPVLALHAHANGEIREGVLIALRQSTGKRIREIVTQRLTDPVAAVRIEALRYGVAHRVPEVLPWLEARVQAPELAGLLEPELRALCIAYGRLARDRAEAPLSELALGRRRVGHPALARFALHGLRAIGTPRARAALQHVASEVPRFRGEVEALLAGDAR
ncbi:MAG: hypothetical protein Q8P41_23655 [Pseudomonadota bacterium]|nr:hypothetical protein [Pseudomonadota bacterium]